MSEYITTLIYGVLCPDGLWLIDNGKRRDALASPTFPFRTFEAADKFTDCGDIVISMWQCLGLPEPVAERKAMCHDGLNECVHCTFCADGKQNDDEEIAASAIGLTKEECNLLGLADGSGTSEKITEIYVKRAILFVFSGGKCLIARKIADVEEGKYRIFQTSQKPVEYYLCLETDYIKIAKDHAAKKGEEA